MMTIKAICAVLVVGVVLVALCLLVYCGSSVFGGDDDK